MSGYLRSRKLQEHQKTVKISLLLNSNLNHYGFHTQIYYERNYRLVSQT